MRFVAVSVVALALVGTTSRASADHEGDADLQNVMVGPVIGLRLGGPPGDRLVIGVEGGVGFGPERINVGFTQRLDKTFVYAELDPWYIIGGTLGVGYEEGGKTFPIIGVWEGVPLNDGPCGGWHQQASLAAGYRYTGIHELYVTIKAGYMNGSICF